MLLNRAPRDRTRHHIRRVRRAADQSDRLGANATIAPKYRRLAQPTARTLAPDSTTAACHPSHVRSCERVCSRRAPRTLRRARQLLTGKVAATLIVLLTCAREGG